MICVVCGVNWPATWSVAAMVQNCLVRAGLKAVIHEVPDLERIGQIVLQSRDDVVLLAARWMSPALLEVLEQTDAVPVIFVDAPASALFGHWLEHTQGHPFDALREVARDLAPLVDLLHHRSAPILTFTPDAAQDIDKLVDFVERFAAIAPRLTVNLQSLTLPDAQSFAPLPVEQPEISAMLAAFDVMLKTGRPQPLPVALPLMLQQGYVPLSGAIDLTGSPRGLFFGPLLALPAGVWTVTALFECTGVSQLPKVEMDAAELLDTGPHSLGRCEFNLIADGQMRISYSFVNRVSNRKLEFRLGLTQGVFDGQLSLLQLSLTPCG